MREERPRDLEPASIPKASEESLAEMGRWLAEEKAPMPVWSAPAVEDLQRLLPAFEVEALIARGGMGAVYRAHQPALERAVALKILPASLRGSAVDSEERFLHEARVMARLNHPGIVPVHEVGELPDGSLYLSMELVEGTDLGRQLAAEGRIQPAEVLRLGLAVSEALQSAHEQGVIHRDIKPANLLMTPEGGVKITDFGLARTPQSGELALTHTGHVMGTPCFIAPELLGGGSPGVRSDLYALGVTLYQLLTGQLPQGAFRPPAQIVRGLDPRWDAVLIRCLESDPADRPPDARTLHEELLALTRPPLKPRLRRSLLLAGLVLALAAIIWQQNTATAVTDLLPRFDIHKGALVGEWSHTADGLYVKPGTDGPYIISTPFEAGTDFDFEIEFSTTNPDVSTFNQFFYVGDTLVEWTLNAHPTWAQPYHGFPRLDGQNLVNSPETHSRVPLTFVPGRRYRSRVEVRQGQLTGWVDDHMIVLWRGDIHRFTRAPHFPIPRRHFAILSWTGGATFHKVSVSRLPATVPSVPPPAVPVPKPADMPATAADSAQPPAGGFFENSLGMKFVQLPGTQSLMAIHETRQRDYAAYARANPGISVEWQRTSFGGQDISHGPDFPVVFVNWPDATAFCQWLSRQEGRLYRLPTDREWSVAAGISDLEPPAFLTPGELGALNPEIQPWGMAWPPPSKAGNYADTSITWRGQAIIPGYADGFPTAAPVMSFPPNQLGIHDLGGNVWEWCQEASDADPRDRILRGAAWNRYHRSELRTAFRHHDPEGLRVHVNGFRCVLETEGRSAVSKSSPKLPPKTTATPAPERYENSLGMKFVRLPGSQVLMAIHETRRQDYEAYASAVPSVEASWKTAIAHGLNAGHLPDHPVVKVSWHDASAFCEWLSRQEKHHYRLPTDREWSLAVGLAAQETTDEPPPTLSGRWLDFFPWGQKWPPGVRAGNYAQAAISTAATQAATNPGPPEDGFMSTSPVMSFPPNQLGIHDLGGNVWEWVLDLYTPSRTDRILRGASWDNYTRTDLLSSYRHKDPPHYRLATNGFRCVVELTAENAGPTNFSKKSP